MARLRYRPPVTKLYPPSTESRLLERPDLVALLSDLGQRKLAVVTAPTGSGKSTLLAQGYRRLVAEGWEAAWLSLDRFDNDPRVFILNLVAAIARVRPGFGDQLTAMLQASIEISVTEAMAAVIGECEPRPGEPARPFVVFLDDFQAIEEADVIGAVGYLLQYSAAQTRFVVASQRAVPLSVARLKSRGAVVEIGFDELRLAADEVREYLKRVHRVALPEERIAALTDQTEGWICGLQLASIALREQGEALFDRGAAGADFANYLLEDILARQAPEVRGFLLDTALLDQFCAPLCDALTGREDGTAMIEALEKANLFIVRLDREQIWYRYHHLFQNFLRAQKKSQGLEVVQPLYLRACGWYEQNAMPAEALHHALAGGSREKAVRLLEGYGYALLRDGNFKELHGWLQAVGRGGIATSPTLCALDAWTQLYLGDAIAASEAVDSAEAVLDAAGAGRQRLADELLILRSMCGVTRYDLVDSDWIRPELAAAFGLEDGLQRAYSQVVLGYGARVQGDLAAARRHYVEAIRIADANEDVVVSLMARYNRAMVDQLAARPDVAVRGIEQWFQEPGNRRWQRAGSAAFLHSVRGLAHLDRLELAQAGTALDAAIELLDSTHTYAYVGVARILRAQVHALCGRYAAAREDIDKAKELGAERTIDRVLFRAAIAQARIALLACPPGEVQWALVDDCLREAREVLAASRQLDRQVPTENFVQYEAILCHRLCRQGDHASLIERAGRAAIAEKRVGRVKHLVEFLGLRSLAARALGDDRLAGRELSEAIRLATPGGCVLPLLCCGPGLLSIRLPSARPPAQPAVASAAASAAASESASASARLRTWFDLFERASRKPQPTPAQSLHRRELQILRLVEQGLRNREVGDRLYISEETVKWYLKRAYEVLGVKNRAHALAKARELRLL
jgi:LuxR family maltose regulon positive regulatory protein